MWVAKITAILPTDSAKQKIHDATVPLGPLTVTFSPITTWTLTSPMPTRPTPAAATEDNGEAATLETARNHRCRLIVGDGEDEDRENNKTQYPYRLFLETNRIFLKTLNPKKHLKPKT
jgi:hypothetical protein